MLNESVTFTQHVELNKTYIKLCAAISIYVAV